ncbi:hypothetical protein WDU94_002238 [Cyamophila willieti]
MVHIQWIIAYENYPNTDKKKQCSPKGSIIDIKGPICIPTADGWERKSADNCGDLLKGQCPEFNQAECIWQPLSFNQSNVGYDCAGGTNLLFPSCRLKYYASLKGSLSKKTWMEIMYVNQYGTKVQKNSDFYIIEIHRWVNDDATEFFQDSTEPDYPLSAPNPKQPGGYVWKHSILTLNKSPTTEKPLCIGGKDVDNFCSSTIRDIYISNLSGDLSPSEVVCNCGSEVRMDEQTNQLIKEDVCKIAQKAIPGGVNVDLFNANDPEELKSVHNACRNQPSH